MVGGRCGRRKEGKEMSSILLKNILKSENEENVLENWWFPFCKLFHFILRNIDINQWPIDLPPLPNKSTENLCSVRC